jgi:hypothetical protein
VCSLVREIADVRLTYDSLNHYTKLNHYTTRANVRLTYDSEE